MQTDLEDISSPLDLIASNTHSIGANLCELELRLKDTNSLLGDLVSELRFLREKINA